MFKKLKQMTKESIYDVCKNFIISFIKARISAFLIPIGLTFLSGIFLSVWAFIKNNYLPLIFILIPIVLCVWYIFKKVKIYKVFPVQSIQSSSEQTDFPIIEELFEFISLREAIIKLNKSESPDTSKEIEEMASESELPFKKYISNYYIEKYLKRSLFGNKVDFIDNSKKELIAYKELPSPLGGRTSSIINGTKWNEDYDCLYSASSKILYTDVSVKRKFLEKLLKKQKIDIFEESL